jgi:hypothetical protein
VVEIICDGLTLPSETRDEWVVNEGVNEGATEGGIEGAIEEEEGGDGKYESVLLDDGISGEERVRNPMEDPIDVSTEDFQRWADNVARAWKWTENSKQEV